MRGTRSRFRIPTLGCCGLGVIYGANGAGKSNLFKALRLLKTIATTARKKDAPIQFAQIAERLLARAIRCAHCFDE